MKVKNITEKRFFKEIPTGHLFSWKEEYFIATEVLTLQEGEVNAVSMITGIGYCFSEADVVIYCPNAILLPYGKEGD